MLQYGRGLPDEREQGKWFRGCELELGGAEYAGQRRERGSAVGKSGVDRGWEVIGPRVFLCVETH